MKHYYYNDSLVIFNRRTAEVICRASTLENAILITDALNDEYLLREKARIQASGEEHRLHLA